MRRLKIAFLTSADARTKAAWSGTHYYMAQALSRVVGDVGYLGPVRQRWHVAAGKAISLASRTLFGRRFGSDHRLSRSRAYAREFGRKLEGAAYDVIVAPAASTEIAFLETRVPIVYLSDTTFANLVDYYETFTRLWRGSIRQGNEIEQRAIAKATLCLYPSQWAADSAVRDYGADPSSCHVIPFGANIDAVPTAVRAKARRPGKTCRLLLLGVDWHRKGGDVALDTLLELHRAGIDAELTVCGCQPPAGVSNPRMRVIPFLDKSDRDEYAQFEDVMWNADFLIVPTRAECYGLVFCEAGAFGLPVLAPNTGGVGGAVHDGVNGFLLPVGASGAEYAQRIASVFASETRYRALVDSSRTLFETRLNWDAWAAAVKRLLEAKIGR